MEKKDDRARKDGAASAAGGGGGGGGNAPYLDRSKVRILLCDNDANSSKEAFTLLCKCSYQVTSVRTPRQVIDALNAEGRDIDIILAEVDLPVSKGLKLLKYIMRDEELRRIPIIMMSAQDDVSVVVKCLKLGAADYLVKPLRTNELLNLWTHMWRRRQMLGLPEKQILNYDFDLVASDPSDANTNSTTLFSDDTDDRSRRSAIIENSISNNREDELNAAASTEPALNNLSQHHSDVPNFSEKMARFSSCPKKSELRIGESSAFFTYVKSSTAPNQRIGNIDKCTVDAEKSSQVEKHVTWGTSAVAEAQIYTTKEVREDHQYRNAFTRSDTIPDTNYRETLHTPAPSDIHQTRNSKEEHLPTVLVHPRNQAQVNVSGLPPLTSFPYYVPGMMNQVMMPSPPQLFQGNQHDFQQHTASTVFPQYNPLQQCSNQVPMMTSYPCYPICMQTGHVPPTQLWPSNVSSSYTQVKNDRLERREAALMKFRQKRKDRCFDKKIRYINRKRLAERRPRVRGQFVRQMNGVDVDLNGHPVSVGDSDEGEEEEEEV